jgi:hypothetical protein
MPKLQSISKSDSATGELDYQPGFHVFPFYVWFLSL